MKHRLSFGFYNIFANNVIEVTADEGIEMTLEMVEECHDFMNNNVEGDFALLINRIHNYTYTYEAKLSIASYEGLKALAFVCYSDEGRAFAWPLSHHLTSSNFNNTFPQCPSWKCDCAAIFLVHQI